jgi:hypothetical protein
MISMGLSLITMRNRWNRCQVPFSVKICGVMLAMVSKATNIYPPPQMKQDTCYTKEMKKRKTTHTFQRVSATKSTY